MSRENVQGVGINHHRQVRVPYLCYQRYGSAVLCPYARPYAYGVERLGVHRLCKTFCVNIVAYDSLRHAYLENVVVVKRGVNRHLAHPRPQASLGGKNGSTSHPVSSSYEQCVPHVALVGKVAAPMQQGAHEVLLKYAEAGRSSINKLLAQPYIEHHCLPYEVVVFRQHHAQLLHPQREGEVSMNDILLHVKSVVFRHQTRRHVDAHHRAPRLVDVLHHGGEATTKRLVEPRAKKPVNHHRIAA